MQIIYNFEHITICYFQRKILDYYKKLYHLEFVGVIHFNHPWFLKRFENSMWVLNFFRFYMATGIVYFLYFLVIMMLICYNREL